MPLKRELTLWDIIIYGVGVIIGAGIYGLIGEASCYLHASTWLAFLAAGIVSILVGLNYAELSSMIPKAGSAYAYVKEAFKRERLAFLAGWLIIFETIIAAAAVSYIFGIYLNGLVPFSPLIYAIVLVLVMTFVNFCGVKGSSRINWIGALVEVGGLLLFIVLGLLHSTPEITFTAEPTGFINAIILVFFAYLGFEVMATSAEEVRNPRRTLPLGIILAILICSFIYVMVAVVYNSVLTPGEVIFVKEKGLGPLAYALGKFIPYAGTLLAVIALFSTMNTVLLMLMAGSRMIYGMSSGGSLPSVFSKVHKRTGTPHYAVLVSGALATIAICVGTLESVANSTTMAALIVFLLDSLALLLLRRKGYSSEFRIPFNIRNYPITTVLSVLFVGFVLVYKFLIDPYLLVITGFVCVLGYLLGGFYETENSQKIRENMDKRTAKARGRRGKKPSRTRKKVR
jgi:APA family basic amino acid/polyamine antiporter